MSHKEKGNSKFSPRERKFLELYLGGALMKTAARAAGYSGASDAALCNTGLRILRKFHGNHKAIFGRDRARQRKMALLLADMAGNGKSERQQLKTLKIMARLL